MEITSIASFLDYYERIRERTLKVIRVIPEEHLDWSFRDGKFTLADQVRHIAAVERFMFAETIAGRQSCYNGCGKELADGRKAIIELFNNLHGESISIIRSLADKDLHRKCLTPANVRITVWKWLRAMVEHEVHHRAQIYIYLSMLDVSTPPLFGLTAEELVAFSQTKN